jgi:HAD superfamily hydrolase (TIGR01490 family)
MSQSEWPAFEKPPAVAFVDVDGTLLAQTTTFLFARILYRRGLISRSFWLRALYHGLQHRFGRLDYGRLIEIGLNSIARIPIVDLERIAYENFVEHVRPRLYEGVVDHMYALRRSGTAIVLVSSSPGLVIEPLSIYLGCTDTLTTPVVVERGRLVGIGSGPACYGEGKRYWAEEWARSHNVLMQDTVAYADNWSDKTLLAEVGRAVVVHPRGRLLRLARARGWDMVWPRRPRRRRIRSEKGLRRDHRSDRLDK